MSKLSATIVFTAEGVHVHAGLRVLPWEGPRVHLFLFHDNYPRQATKNRSSKLWSSQLWTLFMQLRMYKPEKAGTSTGFEPVTLRYLYDALTKWAMKSLTLGAGHLWVLMSPWGMNVSWYMKCFIYSTSAVLYMKHFTYHFTKYRS